MLVSILYTFMYVFNGFLLDFSKVTQSVFNYITYPMFALYKTDEIWQDYFFTFTTLNIYTKMWYINNKW